jgi:hypothetical protein
LDQNGVARPISDGIERQPAGRSGMGGRHWSTELQQNRECKRAENGNANTSRHGTPPNHTTIIDIVRILI